MHTVQKTTIAFSVLAGLGVLANPAAAAILKPTGVAVGGAGEIEVFLPTGATDINGNFIIDSAPASDPLDALTDGFSLADPGGNVEISEFDGLSPSDFLTAATTSLTVDFGNGAASATFESINGTDLFGADGVTAFGDNDLANVYFNTVFDQNLFNNDLSEADLFAAIGLADRAALFNEVVSRNLFQRLADPNLAFALVDDVAGNQSLSFGLAGSDVFNAVPAAAALGYSFNASEIVKVTFGGETTYQFDPGRIFSDSNVISADSTGSFTLTYDPVIAINPESLGDGDNGGGSTSVPEPGAVAGLVAVGGWILKKRLSAKVEASAPRFS